MGRRRRKVKKNVLMKNPLDTTRNTFHRTFRNVKSFLSQRPQKNPTSPSGGKSNPSEKRQLFSPKEQRKGDEESCSFMNAADQGGNKCSSVEEDGCGSPAMDALVQKMKELEMMGVNDEDHALDLQEVVYYYSLLTCPVYLEMVERFFMDMYAEFLLLHLSRSANSSMRKAASASVHSSMRKIGSARVPSSMRNITPLKL